MYDFNECVERAKIQGIKEARDDIAAGRDRSDDDVIADTEALVFTVTGRKVHEFEEDDIVALVEAHDEAYIETFVSESRE